MAQVEKGGGAGDGVAVDAWGEEGVAAVAEEHEAADGDGVSVL